MPPSASPPRPIRNPHPCGNPACATQIDGRFAFCTPDWFRIPEDERQAFQDAYHALRAREREARTGGDEAEKRHQEALRLYRERMQECIRTLTN